MKRTAIADGTDISQKQAAVTVNNVQDAVNLIAIVGSFHRVLHLLHDSGVHGDDLNNHPVALAFVSKLNSLCRMNLDREMAALEAIHRIEQGESVEYEVIPL